MFEFWNKLTRTQQGGFVGVVLSATVAIAATVINWDKIKRTALGYIKSKDIKASDDIKPETTLNSVKIEKPQLLQTNVSTVSQANSIAQIEKTYRANLAAVEAESEKKDKLMLKAVEALEQLENTHSALKTSLIQKVTENTTLKNQLSTEKEYLTGLLEHAREVNSILSNTIQDNQKEKAAREVSFTRDKQHLEGKLKNLQSDYQELKQDLDRLSNTTDKDSKLLFEKNKKIEELQTQNKKMTEEHSALKKEFDTSRKLWLEKEESLKAQLAKVSRENTDLQGRISELEKAQQTLVADEQQKQQGIRAEKNRLQQQLDGLQDELNKNRNDESSKNKELEKKMRDTNQAYIQAIQELVAAKDILRQKETQWEENKKNYENQSAKQQQKIAELENQLTDVQIKLRKPDTTQTQTEARSQTQAPTELPNDAQQNLTLRDKAIIAETAKPVVKNTLIDEMKAYIILLNKTLSENTSKLDDIFAYPRTGNASYFSQVSTQVKNLNEHQGYIAENISYSFLLTHFDKLNKKHHANLVAKIKNNCQKLLSFSQGQSAQQNYYECASVLLSVVTFLDKAGKFYSSLSDIKKEATNTLLNAITCLNGKSGYDALPFYNPINDNNQTLADIVKQYNNNDMQLSERKNLINTQSSKSSHEEKNTHSETVTNSDNHLMTQLKNVKLKKAETKESPAFFNAVQKSLEEQRNNLKPINSQNKVVNNEDKKGVT